MELSSQRTDKYISSIHVIFCKECKLLLWMDFVWFMPVNYTSPLFLSLGVWKLHSNKARKIFACLGQRIAFYFCSCMHTSGWSRNTLYLNLISAENYREAVFYLSWVIFLHQFVWWGLPGLGVNASSSLACCGLLYWSQVTILLCSSLWCLSFFLVVAPPDISNSLQEKKSIGICIRVFFTHYFPD